ncbi:predicted protein [Postia placenta Mad-698-R]|nr:predicted protein [Postia placenta Mad-698-R]
MYNPRPRACCIVPCEEDGRSLSATARGARAFAEGEAGTPENLKKAYAFYSAEDLNRIRHPRKLNTRLKHERTVEFALQVSHFLARAAGAQRAQRAGYRCCSHKASKDLRADSSLYRMTRTGRCPGYVKGTPGNMSLRMSHPSRMVWNVPLFNEDNQPAELAGVLQALEPHTSAHAIKITMLEKAPSLDAQWLQVLEMLSANHIPLEGVCKRRERRGSCRGVLELEFDLILMEVIHCAWESLRGSGRFASANRTLKQTHYVGPLQEGIHWRVVCREIPTSVLRYEVALDGLYVNRMGHADKVRRSTASSLLLLVHFVVAISILPMHLKVYADQQPTLLSPTDQGFAPLLVPNSTRSFWIDTPGANPLAKEGSQGTLTADADVCIIGSRITGISAAYHLGIALEENQYAETPPKGAGATGRNDDHLTPWVFRDFSLHANDEALRGIRLEQHTAAEIVKIIKEYKLDSTVGKFKPG